ncbi:unnamed protein product [Allacma fusca]|uniref:Uncharacterized protein n=1 Tax=Allacma fusca TaxID=39272 RepID=A0A8J2PWA0_9HEXA|nr:unnamed protein product [Allacma fusca]
MAKKVCCCRIATWSMIIAWIKIIFHVVYIILLTLSLMGILGDENLRTNVRDNPGKYPEYYKVLEYAYEYLLFYLFCLMGYNILGLPLNIVLLRGALQRNERKLTIWMYYSLSSMIIMFPYVMFRLISKESITNSAIRLTMNYLFESFCLWGVWALLKEIKMEKEDPQCFTFSPTVMMINEAEENPRDPSPLPPRKDPFAEYNLT